MSRLDRVLTILMLAGLLLGACSPATLPPPAPTAAVPPAGAPAAESPATAPPTASPAASPTAAAPPPAATTAVSPTAEAAATSLAVVNGTLIDGTGAPAVPDAVVVIQAGRITAAGPAASVAIPAGAETLDAGGGTILPGFINTRVHDSYDAETLAAWAQAGVTTVCDLGALDRTTLDFASRDKLNAQPQNARLLAAGLMVTAPGSWPISMWFTSVAVTVTSPADAREKVGQLLDSGAEVISIHLGEQPSLSADEVAAIVQVAHGRGVPVAAGVRFSSNQALALDAGVDNASIDGDDELPDEILGRLVKSGLTVVPALEFFTGMGYSYYAKENFRRFVAAGGKVALGTGYTTRLGGMSLGMPIKEMEMMAQAGMTPMQIIVAATLQAARVCHREKDLGTVEAGKIADLLVVKGDPLADLQALTRACLVLRDGVVIRPNHCAQ